MTLWIHKHVAFAKTCSTTNDRANASQRASVSSVSALARRASVFFSWASVWPRRERIMHRYKSTWRLRRHVARAMTGPNSFQRASVSSVSALARRASALFLDVLLA